jgi:hypothetical protein
MTDTNHDHNMPAHQCDPSSQPGGGLLTLARTLSAVIDVMNSRVPGVLEEVDQCPNCRGRLSIALAGFTAQTALAHNPNSRMGYEMGLAAVQAALDDGEVETPPDGFPF